LRATPVLDELKRSDQVVRGDDLVKALSIEDVLALVLAPQPAAEVRRVDDSAVLAREHASEICGNRRSRRKVIGFPPRARLRS